MGGTIWRWQLGYWSRLLTPEEMEYLWNGGRGLLYGALSTRYGKPRRRPKLPRKLKKRLRRAIP
jgi:hypothetical protein